MRHFFGNFGDFSVCRCILPIFYSLSVFALAIGVVGFGLHWSVRGLHHRHRRRARLLRSRSDYQTDVQVGRQEWARPIALDTDCRGRRNCGLGRCRQFRDLENRRFDSGVARQPGRRIRKPGYHHPRRTRIRNLNLLRAPGQRKLFFANYSETLLIRTGESGTEAL